VPRYLGREWFVRVAAITSGQGADDPGFRVEYRVSTDRGTVAHTQTFSDDGLVSWVAGSGARAPDLVVRRTAGLDCGDLLGRSDADVAVDGTRYALGTGSACDADVFAIAGSLRRTAIGAPSSMRIGLVLHVPDTPQGPTSRAYEVRGAALVASEAPSDVGSIEVSAPYRTVMRWLHHGDLVLGPLVWNGSVRGDICRISAVSGVVCSVDGTDGVHQTEVQTSECLLRYQRFRRDPGVLGLLDEIESWTEPC
jgi:hypothetical protein